MAKFTDRTIQSLRPRVQRYEVWDSGSKGFGVRVTPRGVKSFVWVYHFEGRPRRLTFGTYPALSLGAANLKLAEAKQALARGEDPAASAVSDRAAERAAETTDDLVADYLERYARPRKRSAAEDERILCKDVLPRWSGRKVKNLTRRDVVALLNGIIDRGAPIQANRTFSVLRRMFHFAIGQAIIEMSPCDKVELPAAENQRDRVLSADEIRTFWNALDGAAMEENVRRILRFMLVTGQRKAEVVGLRADEIDLEKAVWALPGVRAKNGREHLIPLPRLALEILAEAVPNERGYIFPSGRKGVPYRGQSVDHATRYLFDAKLQTKAGKAEAKPARLAGMERFTPHDLRRTVATGMRELGISRADVKLVLNHRERDVTARYDRYDGLAEKKRALELWSNRLEQVIKGREPSTNIVELVRL